MLWVRISVRMMPSQWAGKPVPENAVTRRNYQPLQMHRMTWTDLSEDQVLQALKPSASGPGGKAAPSDVLAGKRLKIVTDGGPVLEYHFRTARELELSENGGKAVKTGYGALPSGELVLVSHMRPGTESGRLEPGYVNTEAGGKMANRRFRG